MSLYVAQQLYRAFTLNFSAHSAPQRTTLSADNRDPTIGAGDRYNHYSHSRSLTELIVGRYCQFIKAVNPLYRSLPRDLLQGPF